LGNPFSWALVALKKGLKTALAAFKKINIVGKRFNKSSFKTNL
jgi:hypothetical protein